MINFNFLLLKGLTKFYIGHSAGDFPAHDAPSGHISDTFHGHHSPFCGHKRLHQDTIMTKHENSLLWAFHRFKQTCSLLGLGRACIAIS